ncbi:hypothetical protein QR680_011559 [Steinernema hermaphroditum]|uniref:Autophagy-related protein 101 n=1 Tax=Steinernema hermaphroditum TaxID=289476 RepID=A0AA39I0G1_9BILA|nr:hypothetical protein QR680_011559 [Steinernema hermaphroditum]
MNALRHKYHLTAEIRHLKESLLCFLHTILLHRTVGKRTQNETFGTGLKEEKCSWLDLTYLRVNSPELRWQVEEKVEDFLSAMTTTARTLSHLDQDRMPNEAKVLNTSVKIEFFTRRKKSAWEQWTTWTAEDTAVWEMWELDLSIVKVGTTEDLHRLSEKVSDDINMMVLQICSAMNRGQYIPKSASSSLFDGSLKDCMPYNHRIKWTDGGMGGNGSGDSISDKLHSSLEKIISFYA